MFTSKKKYLYPITESFGNIFKSIVLIYNIRKNCYKIIGIERHNTNNIKANNYELYIQTDGRTRKLTEQLYFIFIYYGLMAKCLKRPVIKVFRD